MKQVAGSERTYPAALINDDKKTTPFQVLLRLLLSAVSRVFALRQAT